MDVAHCFEDDGWSLENISGSGCLVNPRSPCTNYKTVGGFLDKSEIGNSQSSQVEIFCGTPLKLRFATQNVGTDQHSPS